MKLLKKNEKFVWNEDKAFTELRDLLCSEPLLEYLRKLEYFDFFILFIVTTDTSGYVIGDILN